MRAWHPFGVNGVNGHTLAHILRFWNNQKNFSFETRIRNISVQCSELIV